MHAPVQLFWDVHPAAFRALHSEVAAGPYWLSGDGAGALWMAGADATPAVAASMAAVVMMTFLLGIATYLLPESVCIPPDVGV